jgi:hypothetical protein
MGRASPGPTTLRLRVLTRMRIRRHEWDPEGRRLPVKLDIGKSVAEEAHEPNRVASLLGDAGHHHIRRRPDEGRVPAPASAERERPLDRHQPRVVEELDALMGRPQLLRHPDHERAHGRHGGNIVNDPGGEGGELEHHH